MASQILRENVCPTLVAASMIRSDDGRRAMTLLATDNALLPFGSWVSAALTTDISSSAMATLAPEPRCALLGVTVACSLATAGAAVTSRA